MIHSTNSSRFAMLGGLVGTLLVTSCQLPDGNLPPLDPTVMGDGTSNKTNLGGYWWTLVDRSGTSRVIPDTGKLDPNDTSKNPPPLHLGLGVGNGLEEDETGNPAFHITGSVGSAPEEPPPEQWLDGYWNAFYAPICQSGNCDEYMTPAAGLAFGFKLKSAPLGDAALDAACVSFRIKLGTSHEGLAAGHPRPITIMLPMDVTEPPDPTFSDEFGTMFDEAAQPVLYPNQSAHENYPLCAFAGSLEADGSGAQGRSNRTCFCHFATTLTTVTATWKTFTFPWSSFSTTECPGLATALYPPGGVAEIIPQRLIQMRFDAYRPLSSEPPAAFDFWVDDVKLLGAADCT